MANKICAPLLDVPEQYVVKATVESGETYAGGEVILCETLDTNISNNLEVYAGDNITDVSTQVPCIIINAGFEKLSDDRRPEGSDHPGTFTYTDKVTAVRLDCPGMKFFIADACLATGTPVAGNKLAPVDDARTLSIVTVSDELAVLNVDGKYNFPIAGNHGRSVAVGSIARVVPGAGVSNLQDQIGDLSTLTTTEKGTVVGAINELDV